MGKRPDRLVQDEAAMVEDLLELGGGLATLTRSQIGFATDKDWKHRGPIQINGSRRPKLRGWCTPKTLNGPRGISFVERKLSADARQIIELHNCVFRKPLVQIVDQRFRSRILPGVGKRERSKILQIACGRELQCQSGASPRFVSVAEPGFSQSRRARVEGGRVLLSAAFGVIHCAAAELAGVSKVPGVGGTIAFHAQYLVPQPRQGLQL